MRADGLNRALVYTCTADGLRMAENADGEATTFVWDLASPLAQVLATSDGARYVHGLDLVAERRSGVWAYPLGDALGSVRQWTDEDGYVNYAGGYTPFGTQLWTEGSTSSSWGYTGEWWDASVGMVYLRARWYALGTGRFTQVDPVGPDYQQPQSINRYVYVRNSPVRFIDPSGLCTYGEPDYIECMQLARLLAEAYGQPIDSTPDSIESRFSQYARLPYPLLLNFWAQADPVHSQRRYSVIEQEASRFGLPPEFLAAVIAAEVAYDTDWINTIYDVWTTCLDWSQPDFLPINPLAKLHLELWHHYYGLGPLYFNPEHGYGPGPAPGIGNLHVGVAASVEQYFANTYADESLLPPAPSNARRLQLIHRYEWNVRYVAAYLRQLADARTGSESPRPDLTDNDMEMIFVAYHADLEYCFGSPDPTQRFQQATATQVVECQRIADQLGPFLDLYRRR